MRSEEEVREKKRRYEMRIRALKRMKEEQSYHEVFLTAGDVDRRITEYNHKAHNLEWVLDSDNDNGGDEGD